MCFAARHREAGMQGKQKVSVCVCVCMCVSRLCSGSPTQALRLGAHKQVPCPHLGECEPSMARVVHKQPSTAAAASCRGTWLGYLSIAPDAASATPWLMQRPIFCVQHQGTRDNVRRQLLRKVSSDTKSERDGVGVIDPHTTVLQLSFLAVRSNIHGVAAPELSDVGVGQHKAAMSRKWRASDAGLMVWTLHHRATSHPQIISESDR